jgi:hypothetical protein
MANRHSHKKLRAEIRARMASTGETYQTARQRILLRSGDPQPPSARGELLQVEYFGVPLTLALLEQRGRITIVLVPGGGGRAPRSVRALSTEDVRRLSVPPTLVFLQFAGSSARTQACHAASQHALELVQ